MDRGVTGPPGSGTPRPPTRPPRWGLGDFGWVYVTGILAGAVLGSVGIAIAHDRVGHVGALGTALSAIGQFGGWLVLCAVVSRTKGRGSMEADFGFRVDISSWWALFAGIGLFLVGSAIWAPLHALVHENQKVVDDLTHASGAKLAVFAIVAGVAAPVVEELLFRGLLLRALRRRLSPALAIGVQALAFALAHPMLSPTLGDLSVVPTLFLLGTVSGVVATETGDCSASILMHVGFNLLTTVFAL